MVDLRLGDMVLSFDRSSGTMVYSEVIMFLDRDPLDKRRFLRISTAGGKTVSLTPSHLVLRLLGNSTATEHVFAADVSEGDHVMVARSPGVFVRDTVTRVESVWVDHGGVYAPLTRTGTIIVDDVLVSCYAVIDSQTLAHWAFAPYRFYVNVKESLARLWMVATTPSSAWSSRHSSAPAPLGIHPYARFLYVLSDYVVPDAVFFGGRHDSLS